MKIIRKIEFQAKRFIKKLVFLLKNDDFKEFNSFYNDNNNLLTRHAPNELKDCCKLIEQLGLTYRITDGTILGIYRDGRLIPHDNDIDIDVLVERGSIEEDRIISGFETAGYMLGRKVYYKNQL